MSEATGDPFDLFVHAHEREVRAFLASIGVPLAAVDDLAQDVFIDYFLQAEGRYDATAARLQDLARSKAHEHFQRSGRQHQFHLRYADEIACCTSPFQKCDGTDGILEHLAACLDRLPAEQHQLIEHYFGEEEDPATIATSLDCSISELRLQIHHLREQLRRSLHEGLQEKP